MKILAGIYKGRKLLSPREKKIRPTSEKTRGAIFDMLHAYFEKKKIISNKFVVLDCFCGTGAFGIEAISRGSKRVIFSDICNYSIKLTRANLNFIGIDKDIKVLKIDYTKRFTFSSEIDLFFMDPPYRKKMINSSLHNLLESNWLNKKCLGIIETNVSDIKFEDVRVSVIKVKKIGKSYIYFIKI